MKNIISGIEETPFKASRHRILCVTKYRGWDTDRYITHIGGILKDGSRWRIREEDAIVDIESGKYKFYVEVDLNFLDVVVAKSPDGHKYLKTTSDGEKPDALLSLPECE